MAMHVFTTDAAEVCSEKENRLCGANGHSSGNDDRNLLEHITAEKILSNRHSVAARRDRASIIFIVLMLGDLRRRHCS